MKQAKFLPLKNQTIYLDTNSQKIKKTITKYGGKIVKTMKNASVCYLKEDKIKKCKKVCYDLNHLDYILTNYKRIEKEYNKNFSIIYNNENHKIRSDWFVELYKPILNQDIIEIICQKNNIKLDNLIVYNNYDVTLHIHDNQIKRIQILKDKESNFCIYFGKITFLQNIIFNVNESFYDVSVESIEIAINRFNNYYKYITNTEWKTDENNSHNKVIEFVYVV